MPYPKTLAPCKHRAPYKCPRTDEGVLTQPECQHYGHTPTMCHVCYCLKGGPVPLNCTDGFLAGAKWYKNWHSPNSAPRNTEDAMLAWIGRYAGGDLRHILDTLHKSEPRWKLAKQMASEFYAGVDFAIREWNEKNKRDAQQIQSTNTSGSELGSIHSAVSSGTGPGTCNDRVPESS